MIERILLLPGGSLTVLLGLPLILSISYIFISILLDPLRHLPGPRIARFTRLWYLYQIYQGRFEQVNIALHQKYGPIVRIAPGEYSLDDVNAAKIIYGHKANVVSQAPWYYAWSPADPNKSGLFSDLNPHRHASQRRKFASAYSMSTLVSYEQYVDHCTALLVQRFDELAQSHHIINLYHWLQCYAFDVIGEITFGVRFGLLDMGKDEAGIFTAIDGRNAYGTFVGIYPFLNNLIFPYLPKSGGFTFVIKFAVNQISKKMASLKDPRISRTDGPPDFVSKLVARHEEDPEKITKADIQMICQSNIAAGSDTTAISLSSIMYFLMKHPESLGRLRKEIDDAATNKLVSDPVTFKQAQEHLPFLQAVIKEALRLHPAVGLGLQRIVPEGGVDIAAQKFPPGTTVGVNAWVSHRNQATFGTDAKEWRPERWLEDGGKEMEGHMLSFGMGSRTCIGKNISLLEMSKLIPQLIRTFDFQLEESLLGRGWQTESRWFVKQIDFRGSISRRKL
ncbi:Pisatin demethylase [Lachnellula hyalina]|uniref:Pisatin demethylase n=1 Tax=Lachnellula hyalina TaxID=1316788 RepID=A0A8H8R918_9HELO|nr:Pisatin demethylase [Lachnellula hyalina]TVY29916.1 Pisatin demethylase [Lachnellula hyalina]